MPSSFPTNPDTFTTKVDGVDTVMASHINNLQDAMMAVEDFALDLRDGWCYDTDTWVYVNSTSFKIVGKDVRYKFPKGTKIKLVQTSTKYFYVVATAYSADTTITITGGSDYSLVSGTISGQAYSYADTPQGFPQWFNIVVSQTGWTVLPSGIYKFCVIGNVCHYIVHQTDGTSNSTNTSLGIPIIAETTAGKGGICGYAVDNGVERTAPTKWWINGHDNVANFYTNMLWAGWTASGTKKLRAMITYEI